MTKAVEVLEKISEAAPVRVVSLVALKREAHPNMSLWGFPPTVALPGRVCAMQARGYPSVGRVSSTKAC